MNKKRFLFFISLIIVVLIPVLYFILKQSDIDTSLHEVVTLDEVQQFYYRAVPGLRQAEEAGLIREVNKQIALPGQDAVLFIDKIWYNKKNVIIFYHVSGVKEIVYLGGEFYLPTNEPNEKRAFYGSKSIGSNEEKGMLYNESFYSCLKLPPLHDSSGQLITEIETLTFAPFVNYFNIEKDNQLETIPLKSIDITLEYNQDEEKTTKIPTDSQITFDERQVHFYQFDISPSVNRLYFQYLNSGRDKVIRVKGSYTSDKGESQTFDVFPNAITDYPYHYTMELPPFHLMPESVHIYIDSLVCVGNDNVSFKLDTKQFGNKNRSHETEIGKNRIRGTDIYIKSITLNNSFVDIYISFVNEDETDKPFVRIYPALPVWAHESLTYKNEANYLLLYNYDYELFNTDKYAYGADILSEQEMCLSLDREFWDEANTIYLQINNLTYFYQINKSTQVKLNYEKSYDSE